MMWLPQQTVDPYAGRGDETVARTSAKPVAMTRIAANIADIRSKPTSSLFGAGTVL